MRRRLASALLLMMAGPGGGQIGCSQGPDAPFLLLISIDTLRADHVGAYGGPGRELGLTPRLDALSRESTRFEYAFAPASYTLPSVAAMLTGRYPEEIGISANRSLFRGTSVTLAEVLRLAGWRTAAVVSNYVLRSGTGIEIGFDLYDDEYTHNEANREQPERSGDQTTDAALTLLDRLRSEPAEGHFLWVHYQDPHGPYLPAAGHRDRYLARLLAAPGGDRELPTGAINPRGALPSYQQVGDERRVGFYRAGYAGEVSTVDHEVGRLLDGLAERGLAERAIVAFTADHGESLGEDDYWFAHGELLSNALVHIPLWIRVPGREAALRSDAASLVDIFPTLLSACDVALPAEQSGRDLFAPKAETLEPTLYMATLLGSSTPRYGIVRGPYRYLIEERKRSRPEMVQDRNGEALASGAPAASILRELRQEMARVRGSLRLPDSSDTRQRLSPHDEEMLRQLGYAE